MKNNKDKILMIVGIITLLVFVVGATFAYFVAQDGNAEQTNINVTTHTTDSLVFEVGKAISITADQTTFAPGAGNRSDDTFARATLKANSSTNSATANYYVYLNIDTNEFKYTTDTKTAELILTVNYKDNAGNVTPVTSINGLNYVTVGEVSGFDITEHHKLITIANNYEITSTGTEVDEWDITLTLVNLDSNQNNNTGKTFNGTLMIQKQPVAAQYIASLFTTQGANHLYLHDSTLANSAEDGSYRYAGGNYKVAETYKDTYETIRDIIKFEENSANSLNALYLVYDINKTYYTTMKSAVEKAMTDGYIEKDSVNNYVCFGTDSKTCDDEYLYRIIGVFDNSIKLIKADYATEDLLGTDGDFFKTYLTKEEYGNDFLKVENSGVIPYKGNNTKYSLYYWNGLNASQAYSETQKYNVWSYSELNKTNLNHNYLNNIGEKWSNMIADSLWYVGGGTDEHLINSNAKTAYDYEVGNNKEIIAPYNPYRAKVGLMYLSDYYYSALPEYWILPGFGEDNNYINDYNLTGIGSDYTQAENENWMVLGDTDATITRSMTGSVFYVDRDGLVNSIGCLNNYDYNSLLIRPTFYLKSSVTFAGGTGTSTDPYRIA